MGRLEFLAWTLTPFFVCIFVSFIWITNTSGGFGSFGSSSATASQAEFNKWGLVIGCFLLFCLVFLAAIPRLWTIGVSTWWIFAYIVPIPIVGWAFFLILLFAPESHYKNNRSFFIDLIKVSALLFVIILAGCVFYIMWHIVQNFGE